MAVKKSNPIGKILTVIVLALLAYILYYALILTTQAGPEAEKLAERARNRITIETPADISSINYDDLCEAYQLAVTREEFERVKAKKAPDEETLEMFEKINAVESETGIMQAAATYFCGTEENPIVGTIKIKGIEYKITLSITFAPEAFTFTPKIYKWKVTAERLTFA